MTRNEHLLTIVMEECAEVAQRVSKVMRFGMDQIQQDADDAPEQNPKLMSNRERVMGEYFHLRAVMGMAGFDAWDTSDRARSAERQKVNKVEKYLERSQRCGTLETAAPRSGLTHEREEETRREDDGQLGQVRDLRELSDAVPAVQDRRPSEHPSHVRAPENSSPVGPVRVPGLDLLLENWRAMATQAAGWAEREAREGDGANAHAHRKERRIWATCADQLEAELRRLRAGAPAEPSDVEGEPAPIIPGRNPRPATISVGAPAGESAR